MSVRCSSIGRSSRRPWRRRGVSLPLSGFRCRSDRDRLEPRRAELASSRLGRARPPRPCAGSRARSQGATTQGVTLAVLRASLTCPRAADGPRELVAKSKSPDPMRAGSPLRNPTRRISPAHARVKPIGETEAGSFSMHRSPRRGSARPSGGRGGQNRSRSPTCGSRTVGRRARRHRRCGGAGLPRTKSGAGVDGGSSRAGAGPSPTACSRLVSMRVHGSLAIGGMR